MWNSIITLANLRETTQAEPVTLQNNNVFTITNYDTNNKYVQIEETASHNDANTLKSSSYPAGMRDIDTSNTSILFI